MCDLIRRQDAIDALDEAWQRWDVTTIDQLRDKLNELLLVIPSAQPDSKELSFTHKALDTISRQDAIRIVDGIDTWQAGWRGDAIESMKALPTAQPETHEKHTETHACDCIERQAAIDDAHAMPDFEKVEKVIIDNLYVGDKKVTDLIASGRLRLVGFCKECKHCFPPLVCKVDGEVVQVTSDRCSICGYVEKNGWCYKFEMRTDMRGEQDE